MAEYFNAKDTLPMELIMEVMEHIPQEYRNGAIIYFSEDYCAKRNAEIIRCFQIYQSDPRFGTNMEIYEALSEEYGLASRQICKIVKGVREGSGKRSLRRRRYSGIHVERASRKMNVRTAAVP